MKFVSLDTVSFIVSCWPSVSSKSNASGDGTQTFTVPGSALRCKANLQYIAFMNFREQIQFISPEKWGWLRAIGLWHHTKANGSKGITTCRLANSPSEAASQQKLYLKNISFLSREAICKRNARIFPLSMNCPSLSHKDTLLTKQNYSPWSLYLFHKVFLATSL